MGRIIGVGSGESFIRSIIIIIIIVIIIVVVIINNLCFTSFSFFLFVCFVYLTCQPVPLPPVLPKQVSAPRVEIETSRMGEELLAMMAETPWTDVRFKVRYTRWKPKDFFFLYSK
jgi:hypothetical protein